MIEPSKYVLELLWKDSRFGLYRGRGEDDPDQILLLSPLVEYPAPGILKRLEHEYSLREALDPTWAARPIAMARHWDRPVLVLEDPGGLSLDQLLGQPLEIAFSLRLAVSVSRAIAHLHQCGSTSAISLTIEFAGCEQRLKWNQDFLELIYDR